MLEFAKGNLAQLRLISLVTGHHAELVTDAAVPAWEFLSLVVLHCYSPLHLQQIACLLLIAEYVLLFVLIGEGFEVLPRM